jgi:nucleotide-binding universal stress UspA family protein
MRAATSPSRDPNTTERGPTIVVGYDGSTEAQAALEIAAARAGKAGTVVAAYAAELAPEWLDTPHYAHAAELRTERAARIFDDIPSLALGDVKVEAELVDGPTPEAVARVAKLRDAQEIAVGSRRLGWFRGAVGSVSRRVLRIADRPVVVVPRTSVDAEPAPPAGAGRASPPLGPISAHSFRF